MRLQKLSMQFAMHETGWAGAALEAYERLIYDAAHGDRTLFTTADGIERLWELSTPLLDNPPVVRPYREGSWGPNRVHQLIAPRGLAAAVRARLARPQRAGRLSRASAEPEALAAAGGIALRRHRG